MRRDKDVRDRLIDQTMRWASIELALRDLTERIKAARCPNYPPCWVGDARETWKDHEADIPTDYCDECVRSTILARERHALRRQRGARREGVLRAAASFKGSIYGACSAGPSAGSGEANRVSLPGVPPCTPHSTTHASTSL